MRNWFIILSLLISSTVMGQVGVEDKLDYKTRTQKESFKKLIEADTSTFKWGYTGSLTLAQTQVQNWQAGGSNNFAVNAVSGAYLDYRKSGHYSLSLLDVSYGVSKIQGTGIQKIQDYIEANTKYGYALSEKWSATLFVEGISQFANGYNYKTDPESKQRNSCFMAPAYFNEGIGLVYEQQNKGIYLRAAPFTARQIVVSAPDIDETRFGLDSGKTVKNIVGASLRADYNKQIINQEMVKLFAESRLMLFTDYHNPEQMLVNWRNKLSMNVAKVFTISLLFHIIYDPKVKFPDQTIVDTTGKTIVLSEKQKVQILQTIGFGIGYSFKSNK